MVSFFPWPKLYSMPKHTWKIKCRNSPQYQLGYTFVTSYWSFRSHCNHKYDIDIQQKSQCNHFPEQLLVNAPISYEILRLYLSFYFLSSSQIANFSSLCLFENLHFLGDCLFRSKNNITTFTDPSPGIHQLEIEMRYNSCRHFPLLLLTITI